MKETPGPANGQTEWQRQKDSVMDPLIREIRVIVVHWFSYIFRAFHARRVPKRRKRGRSTR
jgi:hypothetical protein